MIIIPVLKTNFISATLIDLLLITDLRIVFVPKKAVSGIA